MPDEREQDRPAFPTIIAVGIVLLAACAAYLLTAPTDGDFWWSDAPRHGLNGLFLRDLVLQHPFHDPVGWAYAYYAKRPSLTILFYPPLFYAFEAIAFLVFGFSHFIAQATVTGFVFLLGLSAYGVARVYTNRTMALAAMLLTLGIPETALWGRQIMLDVPAYALITASAWMLLLHIRNNSRAAFVGCAALLLAAIYTKFNACFIALPLAITLIACRGWRILLRPYVLLTAVAFIVLLIPAEELMRRFGSVNVGSVAGLQGMPTPDTLAFYTYYARVLPSQLGWILLVLAIPAIAFMMMALLRGQRLYILPLSWLAFGYLFYTLISMKEPRDTMMILLPIAIAIPAMAQRLSPRPALSPAALAFAASIFVYAVVFCPVPKVSGYQAIADYLAHNAPKHALVVYAGGRDGNLVFDLAQLPEAQDIAVVRNDKLLLSVPSGQRFRGTQEAPYTADQIAGILKNLAPDYLVIQPNFWTDLKVMNEFQTIVDGPDYEKVASFRLTGQISQLDGDGTINILKPKYPIVPGDRHLDMAMPMLGHRMETTIKP